MRSLALISLVGGAMAGVLVQRDLATIQAAMTASGDGIVTLDNAVKAFSGGDASPVSSAADALVQTLKDGKAKVDPTGELSLGDALGLQTPAKDLQAKGDALLADLKAKKDVIAANGLCKTTFDQASAINSASKDLINSVVSKVPEAAQGIAQGIVAGLLKALQDAQDAFSPENCKDTGSPPASSSTAAPPTDSTTAPPPGSTTDVPPVTTTDVPPVTTTDVPPVTTTDVPPVTTTDLPPASDTCPAASTVTVTAVDTGDCTPIPTCTKKPTVTVTSTKKSCPTGSRLPW